MNGLIAKRSLAHKAYVSYTAYILQCLPRLQELCTVILVTGSGGVTGMVVAHILRPGVARVLKRRPLTQQSGIKDDLVAE